MKFTIQREQLLSPLQLVNGVVERRQTLPILGNVLLRVKGKQMRLTGTDLEVELSGTGAVDKLTEAGEITVPARKLFDICRSLPEESIITLKIEAKKLIVSAGNSRFSLVTLPASEFPKVKEEAEGVDFELNVAEFKNVISRTQFAMAQQDVRYYLNGSLWKIEDNTLTVVATDGHRLAMSKVQLSSKEKIASASVIVPRKAIVEIGRVLTDTQETINVVISGKNIRVSGDGFVLSSKLIEGRYPDYLNVVPKNTLSELVVDRDVLKPVLSRVAILSNEKYRGVRLTLNNNALTVNANNPDHEEAEEQLVVDYDGDSFEIGLNVNYLLDALNALPKGNVIFSLSGAEKSIIIEHKNDSSASLNVIMPMRL